MHGIGSCHHVVLQTQKASVFIVPTLQMLQATMVATKAISSPCRISSGRGHHSYVVHENAGQNRGFLKALTVPGAGESMPCPSVRGPKANLVRGRFWNLESNVP